MRLCGNRDDAEDALVEALVRAYRASGQLKEESAFRAWLGSIARRACLRLRDKDSLLRLVPLSEDLVAGDVASVGNHDAGEEVAFKDCVRTAIDRLPPLYREVYLMCEIEDIDAKVVAERLGLSLPAVKSRLLRAREKARMEFDRTFCMDEARTD